jgi:hypothetical protein
MMATGLQAALATHVGMKIVAGSGTRLECEQRIAHAWAKKVTGQLVLECDKANAVHLHARRETYKGFCIVR